MPLLSFEGIDGCGKSTQILLLKEHLESRGETVYVFREPGGTPLSEEIRGILLDHKRTIHPVTEMLLFSSARSDLITQKVEPLLRAGAWVILDRYYDSTTAYQGYGRKAVALDELNQLNELATGGIRPDLTFYLRVDLETARNRRKGEPGDRMEQAGDEFFERVMNGYERIAADYPERVVVLDASPAPDHVFLELKSVLGEHFSRSRRARGSS